MTRRSSLRRRGGHGGEPPKRLRHWLGLSLSLCLSLALCACGGQGAGQLTVAGSTTVLPIAEIAAEKFEDETGIHVLVSGLGSSAGIEAVANGTADIATSSRGLTEEESRPGLETYPVAHDGIAVIVNDANPVSNITLDELRAIYAGRLESWAELGGDDIPILVVNRDEASGTREAFRSIVMRGEPFDRTAAVLPGTGQVRDVVSRTPGAIGYISIGFVENEFTTSTVKTLEVDGIEATEANLASGAYPLSRDLFFFTKGPAEGDALEFIDFVRSSAMDETIRDAGYVPVSEGATGEGSGAEAATGDAAAATAGAPIGQGGGDGHA